MIPYEGQGLGMTVLRSVAVPEKRHKFHMVWIKDKFSGYYCQTCSLRLSAGTTVGYCPNDIGPSTRLKRWVAAGALGLAEMLYKGLLSGKGE